MSEAKTFYVTTPIYYVNDKPHIGHAYTTLACDVLARFKRLDGFKVRFLTGTDEHGQKVEKSAQTAGVDPQTFTDRVSQNFRDLAKAMKFTNDDFIRTTEDRHKAAAQDIWKRLEERGQIYLGGYEGWYSVRDEAFFTETELTKGPNGEKLAPTGAPVEWVEEPSYFFRLSDWQEPLLKFYEEHPDFILPNSRRNEVLSFVKGGLQDLSISRTSFKWGVPVPGDDKHIMYVWLDALTNYMSALGYPDQDSDLYKEFWPASLHMVGKDILRFHAIFWPAFLMAADLPLPKRVFAHGWWTNEGQKISKSLGNVIDPYTLIEEFGLDQTRFFMLREVPFGSDGDFSRRAMIQRKNSELANDYGNLCQRVLSMIAKNCEKSVPQPGAFTDEDKVLLQLATDALGKVRHCMDTQAFNDAIEHIWVVIRAANAYVDHQAPWALRKTDTARMGTVLYVLAETIRRVALLTQPFMPDASAAILDQLSIPEDARTYATFETMLAAGTELPKPQGVFPRHVETEEE